MSELVYVTNKSEKSLTTYFNYEEYKFPVGETVGLSMDAAKHIFGFGVADKEPYLARLGFIQLHSELEEALNKLAKFEITSEFPQKDRSLPSAVGVVPLNVTRHSGGKSNARAA